MCSLVTSVMELNVRKNKTKCSAGLYLKTFSLYAGLIVFCVPVICDTDSHPLTYDYIYNSTSYAQLGQTVKPYKHKNNNESRNEFRFKDKRSDFLVGFAHDPFRYSIPEADYMRGVRDIDPNHYSMRGDRGKRGVFHLYNMLTCATGCDPISYKGYGCYCGFLGSGKPTDGIDNCCRLHDECYENIYCPVHTVYFQPYYWKCFNGEPHCALENYQTQHQVVNGCSGRLCECDRRFAMCVRRYSCPRGRSYCRSDPLRLLQNILMF